MSYDAYLDRCLSDYDRSNDRALADEIEEFGYCAVMGCSTDVVGEKCNRCGEVVLCEWCGDYHSLKDCEIA